MKEWEKYLPPSRTLLEIIPEQYFDSCLGQLYGPARELYNASKINHGGKRRTYKPILPVKTQVDDTGGTCESGGDGQI